MWFDESVIYQIYPLGFVGAPTLNDGRCKNRISKIVEYIPHLKRLNVNTLYLCPVFESTSHGYDTKDFTKIDCRLGTNEDFKSLCTSLHNSGIRIILDGVFNHVGRDFFAFRDVQNNKYNSQYKDWFHINFNGNSKYNDGFYYEGWEGHFELVKLNLDNVNVKNYFFDCIKQWILDFDIDGLRLDVAYMLNKNFMRELCTFTKQIKQDFFLVGEMIHGDYNSIMGMEMLHSATNYECYKGIYSSFNEMNMFEISYSLNRQFGSEHWCLYTGKNLLSFVDNHDVTRIASSLKKKEHLNLAFGLLFTMPGIPCIYYGSEWGIKGVKEAGDSALRPAINKPEFNNLTEFISALCKIRANNKILAYGSFKNLLVTNSQYIFERAFKGKKIVVMINASGDSYDANINTSSTSGINLISNKSVNLLHPVKLQPYSIEIIEC